MHYISFLTTKHADFVAQMHIIWHHHTYFRLYALYSLHISSATWESLLALPHQDSQWKGCIMAHSGGGKVYPSTGRWRHWSTQQWRRFSVDLKTRYNASELEGTLLQIQRETWATSGLWPQTPHVGPPWAQVRVSTTCWDVTLWRTDYSEAVAWRHRKRSCDLGCILRQSVVEGVRLNQVKDGEKSIETKSNVIDGTQDTACCLYGGLGVVYKCLVAHLVRAITCPDS